MMEEVYVLKEAMDSATELIETISGHPAVIDNQIMKKGESVDLTDVGNGDLLEQIDMANKYLAEIDDRIKKLYRSIKSSYSKRFPELKVADPMQYILTAQILGNKPESITDDDVKNQLSEVLERKMHLFVSMTAGTTQGVKLEPEEMDKVFKGCAIAVHLTNLRTKLLSFVERNMATIAPNLSVIVGASIAAKLMGFAGGLMQLATMPPCNISTIGSNKMSTIESSVGAPARAGLIYECDLIQQIPYDHTKDLRKRAMRWVANKCSLAARCDASQSDLNGNAGKSFRANIESQINKALEPPPKKAARPLPAPIEKSGKKRGGKRVRRMKERYAQTELRKAANRMTFGDVGDDAYQNDLGFDRSQLNAIKKLRGPQVNAKSKITLSKSAQRKLAQARQQSGGPTKDAADPSLAKTDASAGIKFTPQQQGLEIYNPEAVESYTVGTSGESSNYFSNTAGFLNVKREDNGHPSS